MPSNLNQIEIRSALLRHRLVRFIVMPVTAIVVLILGAFSARAWWGKPIADSERATVAVQPVQQSSRVSSRLRSQLALQPEADRLRRRLGQRFLAPGREISALAGTVLLGTERYAVNIIRSQEDEGEKLTITLNGQTTFTWSGTDGARSGNTPATGNLRALVERLALDSADQFILAQLRGASYFNVASGVRPTEAAGSDRYDGPVWNLVRVGEPPNLTQNRPQSIWRLYYLNASTGLIEKVVSQEQGQTIVAEVSGWVTQNGETVPTKISWKQKGQTLMDLSLTNITHSQK